MEGGRRNSQIYQKVLWATPKLVKSRMTNLGRLKVRAGEESWFTHIYKSNGQETSFLGLRIYLGIHLPE